MTKIHFYTLIFFFFQWQILAGQCGCEVCPQPIADLSTQQYQVQVSGAASPVLGQAGQGLCGVQLRFRHDFIGDLLVSLTAPSGQTIQLTGPAGLFNETNFSTWNVTFVPCAAPTMPDNGIAGQFSNSQPWGILGNYSGIYHPFLGCFDTLSGSVNGTWTLTVTDAQDMDGGVLLDFQLIFCNPAGLDCQACDADAGNLLQPDRSSCRGDSNLIFQLPPTYPSGQNPPPANNYAYRYVVGSAPSGNLVAIQTSPNLINLPVGNYTVCGLSVRNDDLPNLPALGSITLPQLNASLSSTSPPFCGNLTQNCVNVAINPPLPDSIRFDTLCGFSSCLTFLGEQFCTEGTFTRKFQQNGCTRTAILHLKKYPSGTLILRDTVCQGTCSTVGNFPNACLQGAYSQTFKFPGGCDSLVVLNLVVLRVNAVIPKPDSLKCNQPTVTLRSTGSTNINQANYEWTAMPGGAQLQGPTNQSTATAVAAGQYRLVVCRTFPNGTNCCDTAFTTVIDIRQPLPTPSGIAGPMVLCPGNSATFFLQNPVPNATSYNWSVPAGVQIVAQNADTLWVVWGSTAGNVCVNAINGCGVSPQACLPVQLENEQPITAIAGADTLCQSESNVIFSVQLPVGVSGVQWTASGGAMIQSGQGTAQISVQAPASGTNFQVCASPTSSCGTGTNLCKTVVLRGVPASPNFSGNFTVCEGETRNFQMAAVPGAVEYSWTLPPGANILGGQNGTSIAVQFGAGSSGVVCVRAVNECGASTPACAPVQVSPRPVANAGAAANVCGLQTNLSAVLSQAGNSGMWSQVSGAGTANFSTPTATNSQVSVSQAGNYIFQWIERNAQNCADTATVSINFEAIGSIQNVLETCQPNQQAYVVTFQVLGGVPPFSAVGGSFSGNLFTSQLIPSGTPYSFSVMQGNNCSISAVVGLKNCACATSAGTMQNQLLDLCEQQTAIAQANPDAQMDADDVVAFVLHDASGVSLGNILGINLDGNFNFNQSLNFNTVYYISRVVGNSLNGFPNPLDPCFSVSAGQPVVWREVPVIQNFDDPSTCGLEVSFQILTSTGNLNLTLPTNLSLVSAVNNVFQVQSNSYGTFPVEVTAQNFGCSATKSFNIKFNSPPEAQNPSLDCDVLGQNFTVSFEILGNAPFIILGGSLSGNQFVSNSLPSPSFFQFQISDSNGCTTEVSGDYECESCSNDAGTMASNPILVCGNLPATATVQVLPTFQTGDVAIFVLHSHAGSTLGTVFGQNSTGIFAIQNGMTFGTTYYISQVVGKNDGTGKPDFSDPCLKVAPGQPVIFQQLPTASAGADRRTCLSEIALEAPQGTQGVWSQVQGTGTSTFANPNFWGTLVTVSQQGIYQFEWRVTDATGCSATDTVQIEFLPQGMAQNPVYKCDSITQTYTVSIELSGGTPPYFSNGQPFLGNIFTSDPIASGMWFVFNITDNFGCLIISANDNIRCNCSTSAGSLPTSELSICGDATAELTFLTPPNLDANDALMFVLHDGSANSVGNILDRSSVGKFAKLPNMLFGQTYFVTVLAGNNLNGDPDPTDECFSQSNGQPVRWERPVEAGTPLVELKICQNLAQNTDLLTLLNNADVGGIWQETSSQLSQTFNPVTGKVDFSKENIGDYTYLYIVSGAAPCPSDTARVEIHLLSSPTADAGLDGTLGCGTTSQTLGGANTSEGTGIEYAWRLAGNLFSSEKNPVTMQAGQYIFIVKNGDNCTAIDTVEIRAGSDVPVAEISVKSGKCGELGSLEVVKILGGQAPHLISLNDGVAGQQRIFTGLTSGSYFIKIEDAAGCEWQSDNFQIVAPEQFSVELPETVEVPPAGQVNLEAKISIDGAAIDTIIWSPLSDSLNVGRAIQNFTANNSKNISVTVVDTNGCRASAKVFVSVLKKVLVFVPNILLVGSEFGNESLSVFAGEGVERIEKFEVYDRWGERVFGRYDFLPNDASAGWNGYFKGQKAATGVYVWWVKVRLNNGSTEILEGNVTLIY